MTKIFTATVLAGAMAAMSLVSVAQAEPHRAGTTVYEAVGPGFNSEGDLRSGRSAFVRNRPASSPGSHVNSLLGDDVDLGK